MCLCCVVILCVGALFCGFGGGIKLSFGITKSNSEFVRLFSEGRTFSIPSRPPAAAPIRAAIWHGNVPMRKPKVTEFVSDHVAEPVVIGVASLGGNKFIARPFFGYRELACNYLLRSHG